MIWIPRSALRWCAFSLLGLVRKIKPMGVDAGGVSGVVVEVEGEAGRQIIAPRSVESETKFWRLWLHFLDAGRRSPTFPRAKPRASEQILWINASSDNSIARYMRRSDRKGSFILPIDCVGVGSWVANFYVCW
jgi:hypothetical protein